MTRAIDAVWHIGRVPISGRILLAPMAGVTDLPFRLLCREAGAGLVYTEMASDLALLGASRRSSEILRVSAYEHPVAAQLCGSVPESMALAAARAAAGDIDILDINMGCPAPKIVSNGEGAALMRDPARAEAIVRAVRAAVGAAIPVTVKIRAGWDECSINAVPFARAMEAAGAAAITVHGRVRTQFYRGRADWDIIAAVKQAVEVPVIGNGDVRSGADAVRMLSETGCDAVMIGRAALGNPAIFTECARALDGEWPARDYPSADVALRHLSMMLAFKGAKRGTVEMRKHAAWYLSGRRGAARMRDAIMRSEAPAEVFEYLRSALCPEPVE